MLGAVASRSRTIIDVGANVGRYAWFLRRHARPEATLIALEPHPAAARLLRGAVAAQPGSTVLEVAAADTDGRGALRVPRGSFGSPVPGLGWVQTRESGNPDADIQIELRRIDGLVKDGSIDVRAPVFMKIDVEGSEGRVLRGAEGLLQRERPIIYFECQAALVARQNETPEGVWQVLDRTGYRVFGNMNGAFVPVGGVQSEIVNYLAIPTEVAGMPRDALDSEALTAIFDVWAADGPGA